MGHVPPAPRPAPHPAPPPDTTDEVGEERAAAAGAARTARRPPANPQTRSRWTSGSLTTTTTSCRPLFRTWSSANAAAAETREPSLPPPWLIASEHSTLSEQWTDGYSISPTSIQKLDVLITERIDVCRGVAFRQFLLSSSDTNLQVIYFQVKALEYRLGHLISVRELVIKDLCCWCFQKDDVNRESRPNQRKSKMSDVLWLDGYTSF